MRSSPIIGVVVLGVAAMFATAYVALEDRIFPVAEIPDPAPLRPSPSSTVSEIYFVMGENMDTGVVMDEEGRKLTLWSAGEKVAEVWCSQDCVGFDSVRFFVDVEVFTDRGGRTTARFER